MRDVTSARTSVVTSRILQRMPEIMKTGVAAIKNSASCVYESRHVRVTARVLPFVNTEEAKNMS